MAEPLDEHIDEIIREESAQGRAVKSLIEIKEKKKDKLGSDIEVKTDLDEKQVCVHTAADMLQLFLSSKSFKNMNIVSDLVELKERKLLSKNRESRREIVEVARTPDMQMINPEQQGNFVQKLFTSRKKL